MNIYKGNSWTGQTFRKKRTNKKRLNLIRKQTMNISLQPLHGDEMLQLTLSTSLLMRKNRYSKLRGITPLSSSVQLSKTDGPRGAETKSVTTIILFLDVKECSALNNILNSHQAW